MRVAAAAAATVSLLAGVFPTLAGAQGSATTLRSGTADTVIVSLREAQRLALRQNPSVLAAQQERAIAAGDVRQARLLQFNPEIGAVIPSGDRGAVTGELSVTQQLEVAGQRRLRISAATIGVSRAEGIAREAARATLIDVSAAFLRAVAGDRRRDIAQATLSLNQRLLEAVRIQVREGEVSVLEANLAEIELGRARARLIQIRREQVSADLELKRLLGLSPTSALRLVVDSSLSGLNAPAQAASDNPDSLMRAALERRPDVAAQAAAVRQLEALSALARREAVPNLRVGLVTERDADAGGTAVGTSIGMSLPLFNRNQGLVDRRRAEAAQAGFQLRAVELRARTEVVDAWRSLQAAEQELRAFAESVLQPARDNSALLEAAYRAGKITLPTLLLLRAQLFDAELGYWDAWVARNEARARLEGATGDLLTDATLFGGAIGAAGTSR